MANILKAIAEGTSENVGGAAKTTAKKAMSNMPNPAEAVYNLGLGVGPLLRSIADKAKNQQTAPATEKNQKKGIETDARNSARMTAQIALSNSLLKEIRNIQIKQLTAASKASTIGGVNGRRLMAASDARIRGAGTTAASTMLSNKADSEEKKIPGAGLAMGALGAYAVSKLMNQDLKDALGNFAGSIYKELKPVLVDGISTIISNAWKQDAVWTTVAGLFIAHVTGVLGFATRMTKAALSAASFAKDLAQPYKDASKLAAEKASVTSTNVPKPNAAIIERAGELRAANPNLTPQQAITRARVQIDGPGSVLRMNEAKVAGPAAVAEPAVSAKPSAMSRASSFIKGAGLFGTALTVGEGAVDYYRANEAEKRGEIDRKQAAERKGGAIGSTGGALAGGIAGGVTGGNIGMALGGAVGALFGGVGAIPGAAIGRVLGTLAGGYFGSRAGSEGGQVIGSAVGGINADTGRVNAQSNGQSMGDSAFDLARYRDLVGQHESTNNYAADNRVGFLGRYQFGAAALETLGLLKPGASKGRDRGPQSAVYDPSAWASGYSLEGFLGSPTLQDKVMEMYTSAHYNALVKAGVIKSDMSGEDIASRLYTAHAGGVGGAVDYFKNGRSRTDFHFGEAASTSSAANKMKGSWSSNMATTPAHSTPGSITPSTLSTTSATAGMAFADTQKTLDSLVKVIGGEGQAPININQIINQAMQQSQSGGGGQSPRRNTPNGGNAAATAAGHATPAY